MGDAQRQMLLHWAKVSRSLPVAVSNLLVVLPHLHQHSEVLCRFSTRLASRLESLRWATLTHGFTSTQKLSLTLLSVPTPSAAEEKVLANMASSAQKAGIQRRDWVLQFSAKW